MTAITTPATPAGQRAGVQAPGGHRAAAPTVALGRLVLVELRKLVDTRAARWLIVATIALSAVLLGAMLVAMPLLGGRVSVLQVIGSGTMALQLLLPIVAIMLATSEWTQHVATVTFTVEPRRLRVLAAQGVAVLVASVASFVVVALLAVAGAAVASGTGHLAVDWRLDGSRLFWLGVTIVLSGLSGLALGTLLMNTAAALVVTFLLPVLIQLGSAVSQRVADILDWLNINSAFAPLLGGEPAQANLGMVATSVAFWVVVPLAIGAVRLVRRDVN